MPSSLIRWPERYSPERTSVHAHNELDMPVAPESVWPWLVRADLWPTWYSNSKDVAIEGGGHELRLGTRFRWKTFGASLQSTVEEFVLFERLAWSARTTGINVYHAWLIERVPSGCHVVTEENQNGFLARLSDSLRPRNMERYHQVWLENLLARAESGPPPVPQASRT
jgi:hypothetical protein